MNKKNSLLLGSVFSVILAGCNGAGGSNLNLANPDSVANKLSTLSAIDTMDIGVEANLRSIAYGNGIYVVVGDNGQIMTSSDSKHWDLRNSRIAMNLHSVTFSNELQQFYAVGDSGYLLSSSDGIDWKLHFPMNSAVALYSVMAIGNGLVIGGKAGVIFELTIGARGNEIIVKRNVTGVGDIRAMTNFGNKMLLATSDGSIFIKYYNEWSTHNWTKVTNLGNSTINSLSYDQLDEMFIGANNSGEVFLSNDGKVWSKPIKASNTPIRGLVLDDVSDDFLAVGGSLNKPTIMSSVNFNTWGINSSNLKNSINSIKCFNFSDTCVSVGDNGEIGYIASRDSVSQLPLFVPASVSNESATALLSEVNSFEYGLDKIFDIPIGSFGLKSYQVTSVSKNTALTIQSVNVASDIYYDFFRSTCFNGAGSSVTSIKTLNYGESCTIVYKYAPSSYQPASWFASYVTFKDSDGNLVNSNTIETPYSSRD